MKVRSPASKEKNRLWLAANYANPERRAAKLLWMKRTHHERYYGIKYSDYLSMCAKQSGLCKVCNGPPAGGRGLYPQLVVDHCHLTGRVRGLLCNYCNQAIGLLQDDPNIIRRASDYLEDKIESLG